MANKDLRDWIKSVDAAGELEIIKGAETKEEIGGFVDIYQRKMGSPVLLHRGLFEHHKMQGAAVHACAQKS